MTEQELVEKIAQELSKGFKHNWTIDDYRNQAKHLHTIYKEALPDLAKEAGRKEVVERIKSVAAYDKDGEPFICAHCETCVVIPIWLWQELGL